MNGSRTWPPGAQRRQGNLSASRLASALLLLCAVHAASAQLLSTDSVDAPALAQRLVSQARDLTEAASASRAETRPQGDKRLDDLQAQLEDLQTSLLERRRESEAAAYNARRARDIERAREYRRTHPITIN